MAVPVALLQALPVVLDATCRPAGRAGLRKAVGYACGPKASGFLSRTLQTGLYYSAGPLVPVVCKLGGAPAVDPLLDKLCDAPRGEVANKLVALEAKSRGGKLDGFGSGASRRGASRLEEVQRALVALGWHRTPGGSVELTIRGGRAGGALNPRGERIVHAARQGPFLSALHGDNPIVRVMWRDSGAAEDLAREFDTAVRRAGSGGGALQFAGFFGGA